MGKRILVIGGTSDIAHETNLLLAERGFDLTLVGRSQERLDRCRSDILARFQDREVNTLTGDLADPSWFNSLVETWREREERFHSVFYAAGLLSSPESTFTSPETALSVAQINFSVWVYITPLILPLLEEGGSIVGISSVAGDRGRWRSHVYGAAKAGFSSYLASLRNYLTVHGRNINVLDVRPGYVRTRMTADLKTRGPLVAEPDRVARDIVNAWSSRKSTLYTPWFWRLIMFVIRAIPDTLFRRLSI